MKSVRKKLVKEKYEDSGPIDEIGTWMITIFKYVEKNSVEDSVLFDARRCSSDGFRV